MDTLFDKLCRQYCCHPTSYNDDEEDLDKIKEWIGLIKKARTRFQLHSLLDSAPVHIIRNKKIMMRAVKKTDMPFSVFLLLLQWIKR